MNLVMLITSGSSRLVLRLKKYSDKRNNDAHGSHQGKEDSNLNSSKIDRNSSAINIETGSNQLTEIPEDRSFLGRFLSCKPCRQVTEHHQSKLVS